MVYRLTELGMEHYYRLQFKISKQRYKRFCVEANSCTDWNKKKLKLHLN